MKKLFVLCAALLVGAQRLARGGGGPGVQRHLFGTFDDVVVPEDGVCILNSSEVTDDVKVKRNGYFEAHGTSVGDDVRGKRAQTIFMVDSTVGGGIKAKKTAQVFLFGMTVDGDVKVKRASDKVNVCGVNVVNGDLSVIRSGTDILVGDPLAVDCPGNLVQNGDVDVSDNYTDVELVVRGNGIPRGDLTVDDNSGPSDKFVQSNTGGRRSAARATASRSWGCPTRDSSAT